jgi:predicted GTPase
MKQLHIFKTKPKDYTKFLAEKLAENKKPTRFNLYEDKDYDKLVKLIFENDEVISWW